jgi:hypothetical protein
MSAVAPEGLHGDNDEPEDDEASREASGGGDDGRDSYICVSEQVYVESGNEKKVLYLMCLGLTHRTNNDSEEQPLFSFEQQPWSMLPKNSLLRPKNSDFVHEITRRTHLFNIVPVPRPSNWSRAQIMEWLERNPIQNVADKEFLTNEVFRLRDLFIRAQQHQQEHENSGVLGGGGRNWRGNVPYLRVIMCLTQDNVKRLFLARANARSRQELDARNSQIR